jgi:hypothetical protein
MYNFLNMAYRPKEEDLRKSMLCLAVAAGFLALASDARAESNALALGVEKITKAPFDMAKGGNEHLFTPVKEVNGGALDVADHARAAVVSVGLNFGQAVEG